MPDAEIHETAPVLSVSALLRSVRDTLERRFPLAWVREFEEKVVEMADEWLAENVPETASVGP